jgi:hypothetical protein
MLINWNASPCIEIDYLKKVVLLRINGISIKIFLKGLKIDGF